MLGAITGESLIERRFWGSWRRLGLLAALVFVAGASQSLSEPPNATSASTISYVGRLAALKSSNTSTTANVAVPRAVSGAHALLIAAMLNGAASGVVSARDPAGNVYTVDRDQADGSGNRLVVLSALNVKPLASGAAITVTFPTAAASYLTVDEFAGVAALDGTASASGTAKAFNSGAATTSQPGDLLFGAEGQSAAGGSSWSSGWTPLTSLAGSARRLSPAFEIAGAAGPYSAAGTASGTWMAALAAYTAAPPPEAPPSAALTVKPSSGLPPLTVTADASASTDVDATPIATYTFDFGDGSAVVGPQAGATATHTYPNTGTFNVTVTVTDSGGLVSTASASVTVSADAPPVAKLTVTPSSGAAPLAVTADASASTDTDATKIATYSFDFGDGSAPVGPQSGATATHTYSNTGTFTATVTVTDSAGLTSTASSTVTVSFTSSPSISVFAGYYDTHHDDSHLQPKPDPWSGSAGVVFVGKPDSSSGGWDTSAVMIANRGSATLSGVTVTVDIGSNHYARWGTQSIPVGQSLILTQTAFENFDGSDTNTAGCYGCDPTLCTTAVLTTIPVVHVTVNGVTTNYSDSRQILNTQGADKAGCPDTGGTRNDESENWQQLG